MPLTSVAPAIVPIHPTASIDEIRQRLAELQEHTMVREPEHDGDVLDKTVTWRDAVDAGLVLYDPRPGIVRPPDVFHPPDPDPPGDWDDLTPPPPLENLIVTSIPTGFFIEFDAPTYSQGGGNAYSIIYRANYSGSGPLPTLAAAEECGRCTERSPILIIAAEPGTQSHFWAQPVSHAEDFNGIAPQTPPTGGTNGVSAVAGQLSDDHIANLRAGKILAGSIAVGEYIQSTGFVTGSFGWRILGNGNAEFSNIVARGTVYATAGQIGGASINASGVQSTNYVVNTSGWRLDNATGTIYANDIELPNGTATQMAFGGFDNIDRFPPTGATSHQHTATIASMTTNGEPVTVQATVAIRVFFDSETTIAFYLVTATLVHDTTDVVLSTTRAMVPAMYDTLIAESQAFVTLPLLNRDTLSAGSHQFKVKFTVSWFDSTGAAVALNGSGLEKKINAAINLVATENRI